MNRTEFDQQDLDEFAAQADAWFREHRPADPDFILPESFMEVGTDEQFHFLRDWQQQVYEAGYLGLAWPKEYGGHSMPQAFQDVATRALARSGAPFMPNTIGLNWAGPLILEMGSDEQKRRFIPGILSGADIWCQGFSEPNHGSDLGSSETTATRDGNEWVLSGSKIWTSLGSYARYMILLARTAPRAENRYKGLSFFLIPMDAPGIDPVPIRKMTGEFGFCQTYFNEARVPADCLFGGEGNGWQVAMRTLTYERSVEGGQAGGTATMPFEGQYVLDLARTAVRDGAPALDDPIIRERLVRLLVEERGNQLIAARSRHGALVGDWPGAVALSGKLRVSEWKRRITQFALSLQGANAGLYVGDAEVENRGLWQRAYFQSFSGTIGGGTSEVQHNIIGERVLGLEKDR